MTAPPQRVLLFVDPSSDPNAAGWPLRNILAYLNVRHSIRKIRIICYRSTISESITSIVTNEAEEVAYDINKPIASGWEKHANGKLAPRLADLGALMDPKRFVTTVIYRDSMSMPLAYFVCGIDWHNKL